MKLKNMRVSKVDNEFVAGALAIERKVEQYKRSMYRYLF